MTAGCGFLFPRIPRDLFASLVEQVHAQGAGRLALVGGAVRDALLHHRHRDPLRDPADLDLVLEGSCAHLAHRLQETLGTVRVPDMRVHEQFDTAELVIDGVLFDLAAARTETYPAPGQNPIVQAGVLEDDLARRDFTVNAMALLLQPNGTQQLIDPHGGLAHLARRQLAFLHDASVADDPTRVLRGARYGARLGLRLAPEALSQVRSTLELWPWAWHHGDPVQAVPPALGTRLRMELDLLLNREPWPEALALLQSWSAMPLLDPSLQTDGKLTRRLRWAARLDLPAMAALVAAAGAPLMLAQRLQIPRQQERWLEELIEFRRWLQLDVSTQSWADWGPLEWSLSLEDGHWSAAVVALAVLDNPPCRRPLLRWWGRWRHVVSPVSARELIAAGLHPGPQLGEALRKARNQRLAGMR